MSLVDNESGEADGQAAAARELDDTIDSDLTPRKPPKKQKSRVSFMGDVSRRELSQLDKMKAELEKMRRRDEQTEQRAREYREMEVRKVRAQLDQERLAKGIQLYPNVRESKDVVTDKMKQELKAAMPDERAVLAAETSRLKNDISLKYGLHIKKKTQNMVKMAGDYFSPARAANEFGLPERIIGQLTQEEITDLKQVFDMFDVAGTGFIRPGDVQKLATILGFRAKREVFRGMIDELAKDHVGKVTFINFLEFIIKNQEGADQFDEIQQCFKMLDPSNKGYVTYYDVRQCADDVGCHLSNRMIREMVDEADTSGDGQISIDEFTLIMLKTSAFRSGI